MYMKITKLDIFVALVVLAFLTLCAVAVFKRSEPVEKVAPCPDISNEAMIMLDSLSRMRRRICRNAMRNGWYQGVAAELKNQTNKAYQTNIYPDMDELFRRDSIEFERLLDRYWK